MIIDQYDDGGRMLATVGHTKLASRWPEPMPQSDGWYAHPAERKFPVNTPRNTAASVFYYAAQHDHPSMSKSASRVLSDAIRYHELGGAYQDLLKLAEYDTDLEEVRDTSSPQMIALIKQLLAEGKLPPNVKKMITGGQPESPSAEDEDVKQLTQGLQEKEAQDLPGPETPLQTAGITGLPIDLLEKVVGFVKNRSADVAELKRKAQDTMSGIARAAGVKSAGIDLTENLYDIPANTGLAKGQGDIHYRDAKEDRPDDPQFVDDAEFKFRESKRPTTFVFRGPEVYRLSWDEYRNIVWDKLDNMQGGKGHSGEEPKKEDSGEKRAAPSYDFSSLEAAPSDRLITRLKQALIGGGLGAGSGFAIKKLLERKGRGAPASLIPALTAFGTGAGLFRKAGEAIEDAVSRYDEAARTLNPMERRKYATELRKLAEATDIDLPQSLRDDASDTFRRDFRFRARFRKEAAESFSGGKYLPAYEGLFKIAEELGPEKFASALYELDGRTGMASRWGYIDDPVSLTFGYNPPPPETIEVIGETFLKSAFLDESLYEGLDSEYREKIESDPSNAVPTLPPSVQELILTRLR